MPKKFDPKDLHGVAMQMNVPHGDYTAESGEEARQMARKEGWLLSLKLNQAVCPRCVETGRGFKK